jgi:hypothetical protein
LSVAFQELETATTSLPPSSNAHAKSAQLAYELQSRLWNSALDENTMIDSIAHAARAEQTPRYERRSAARAISP